MAGTGNARIDLAESTGSDAVDDAIAEVIERIQRRFPNAGIGYYLHGSWGSSTASPTSDVDILALAAIPISDEDHREARKDADEIVEKTGVPIDFHLHYLQVLVDDPYVDLTRTGRFLYGIDYRPRLPEPTLDLLARESVLYICGWVTGARGKERVQYPLSHPDPGDEFFGRLTRSDPPRLGKKLNWFASALLASKYSYVPFSASNALEELRARNDSWGEWVMNAKAVCSSVPLDETEAERRYQLVSVCRETLGIENETVGALLEAVALGRLGPRCRELVAKHIEKSE